MDANEITSKPTVADEIRWDVDDALVIAKTLPPAPAPSTAARLKGQLEHAVEAARGYVIEQPVRSMLIAAAGGAALTALLIASLRADRL